MKNSTVILIVMIIVSIIAIFYIYRVDNRVQSIEGRANQPNILNEDVYALMDKRQRRKPIISPSIVPGLELSKIQAIQGQPLEANDEISVSDIPSMPNNGGINMEMIPLPFAGRFYETGEFHIVGHLYKADKTTNNTLPATLPLYGQRIPANQATWQYVVLVNNVKHAVYLLTETTELKSCITDKGCREFKNDDTVKVPDLNVNAFWKVKVYTKL